MSSQPDLPHSVDNGTVDCCLADELNTEWKMDQVLYFSHLKLLPFPAVLKALVSCTVWARFSDVICEQILPFPRLYTISLLLQY